MKLYPQHTIDVITNSSSELFIIHEPNRVIARKLLGFANRNEYYEIEYLDEDSPSSLLCVYNNIIVPRFERELRELNGGTLASYNKDSFVIPNHIRPCIKIEDCLALYEEYIRLHNHLSDYIIEGYNEYKEGKEPRYKLLFIEVEYGDDLPAEIKELAVDLIRTELEDCFQINLDINTGYDEFIENEFDVVYRSYY